MFRMLCFPLSLSFFRNVYILSRRVCKYVVIIHHLDIKIRMHSADKRFRHQQTLPTAAAIFVIAVVVHASHTLNSQWQFVYSYIINKIIIYLLRLCAAYIVDIHSPLNDAVESHRHRHRAGIGTAISQTIKRKKAKNKNSIPAQLHNFSAASTV